MSGAGMLSGMMLGTANNSGATEEDTSSGMIKVQFKVNHPPFRPQVDDVGVEMYVVGSIKQLGSWDPIRAKRMKKGSDGQWEMVLYLPADLDIKYQYMLKDWQKNETVWESSYPLRKVLSNASGGLEQITDCISMEEGPNADKLAEGSGSWIAELHGTPSRPNQWIAELDSPQAHRDSVLPLPEFDNTKAYLARKSINPMNCSIMSESGFQDCMDPNASMRQSILPRASVGGFQDCPEAEEMPQEEQAAEQEPIIPPPEPSAAPAQLTTPRKTDMAKVFLKNAGSDIENFRNVVNYTLQHIVTGFGTPLRGEAKLNQKEADVDEKPSADEKSKDSDKMDAMMKQLDDLKTKMEAKQEAEEQREKEAQNSAKEKVGELQHQLEVERSLHQEEKVKLTTELAELREQLETMKQNDDSSVAELKEQLAAEKAKNERLESDVIAQLKAELETARTKADSMEEQKNREVQASQERAAADLHEKMEEVEQMKAQCEEEEQKSKMRARRLRNGIRSVQGQMQGVRKGFQSLKDEVSSMQADIMPMLQSMGQELETSILHVTEAVQADRDETVSKFNAEVSERKRLHNLVQELKGNIRVFCRVRPISAGEQAAGKKSIANCPSESELALCKDGKFSSYNFDQVFSPNSTQDDIFKETSGLAVSVLDGFNVCMFAYGQTGSGKTFTMEGTAENRGVNYRALETLFQQAKDRHCVAKYEFKMSLMEIYNEQLKDLLELNDEKGELKKLEVKSDPGSGGSYVPDLKLAPVTCIEDVQDLVAFGMKNRSVGATSMNEHSSRSHCVFSVHVTCHDLLKGGTAFGKMHLIDLAGSERLSRTGATGDRLAEAKNINKSLSALGNCILSLVSKSKHVPFRDSKLTHLLQDSLGGDAKMLMFVCVSPCDADVPETTCSLQFAQRAMSVELGPAKRKGDGGANAAMKEMQKTLQEQQEQLKVAQKGNSKTQEEQQKLADELESLRSRYDSKTHEAELLLMSLKEKTEEATSEQNKVQKLQKEIQMLQQNLSQAQMQKDTRALSANNSRNSETQSAAKPVKTAIIANEEQAELVHQMVQDETIEERLSASDDKENISDDLPGQTSEAALASVEHIQESSSCPQESSEEQDEKSQEVSSQKLEERLAKFRANRSDKGKTMSSASSSLCTASSASYNSSGPASISSISSSLKPEGASTSHSSALPKPKVIGTGVAPIGRLSMKPGGHRPSSATSITPGKKSTSSRVRDLARPTSAHPSLGSKARPQDGGPRWR